MCIFTSSAPVREQWSGRRLDLVTGEPVDLDYRDEILHYCHRPTLTTSSIAEGDTQTVYGRFLAVLARSSQDPGLVAECLESPGHFADEFKAWINTRGKYEDLPEGTVFPMEDGWQSCPDCDDWYREAPHCQCGLDDDCDPEPDAIVAGDYRYFFPRD